MRHISRVYAVVGICLLLPVLTLAQVTEVHYLPPSDELDLIKTYNNDLLKLALEKTKTKYGDYRIVPSERQLTQREALKSLNNTQLAVVVPTMTDRYREQVFIPVRVPLYKGLFGVRLMMINNSDADRLNSISDVAQAKNYTFGQGFDWPDTNVLKHNGYTVAEYRAKDELFEALYKGEYDFFPRSVAEIWQELEENRELKFGVADGFYFYYPTAVYFFVAKNMKGAELSKRLTEGLEMAIADGSFDEIFQKSMKTFLDRAKLDGKTVIRLENNLLPTKTPVSESKFWYLR